MKDYNAKHKQSFGYEHSSYYAPLNLRKEFDNLFDEGFFWVALRYVDLTKPCTSCKDTAGQQYEDIANECTSCMGIGFLYTDKIVKTYSVMSSEGRDKLSSIGIINTKLKVWYFKHDVFPKATDYILELDTDQETGELRRPFSINRAHKIMDSQPLFGDESLVEFWRCYVEEANLKIK